ncbi:MAG: GspE/PulE family protein, partial [Thermodesulfobacteriota bacterium]|nr:GspE/PulE family protein [Thermodesulfobacteriota bacterium]
TNLSQEDDDTIIGILNYIITNAFIEKASDIHIEPKEKSFCIRYRIDGMLQHKTDLPIHIAPSFISRLKVLCGLNIAEKRRHQDGRIHARIMDKEVDLRVSFYAFLYGENVVIRILQRQSDLIDIDSLGFSPTNKAKFQQILDQPSGIILATGPTGSGKTTTIYASLKYLNNTQKKIITVEDPIEYTIEGVIQGQINHKLGLSYSDFLKSMMRQDPDIIMVGEIRDTTAAEAVIQAALTGHKVLSTFHTDDTTGALLRLMHMEIDTFLISSTVVSIISQRLVRILCPYCRKPHIPDKHLLASFNMSSIDIHNVEFYEPAGCHYCGNRGFVGRTAIHELLVVNDSIRDAILSRKTSSQIRIIARDQANLISMREDGFYKATRGITSLEEILRVVFYNESDEFSPLSADKIITLCEKGTISLPVHPESPSTIQQTPSAQHIKGNGTVSTTTPHLSLLEGEQFRIRLDTTTIETDTDQIADFFKEYQKITEKMGNPLDHDLLETFVAFIFCTTKHLETSKQAEFFELSLHIKKETITILLETYIPHTLSSPSFRTTKETGLRLVNVLMPFSNLVFPPITEQNPIKKGEPYHKRISLLEFLKKNGTGLGKGNAKTHKKATALKTGLSKTQHTDADLQTKRSGVYKKYVEELEFHGYLAN